MIAWMMRHFREQPFVMATGLAALIHSAWSLGTLFSGPQPAITADAVLNFGQWVREHALLIAWLIPAFAIAFALDVGQISTSHEIRSGDRSVRKYATFVIFAVATYYLQWLYISHHMPQLALGEGVSDAFTQTATHVRDLAVWVIPALLPASTLLYTLSGGTTHDAPSASRIDPIFAVVLMRSARRDNPEPPVCVRAERKPQPALEAHDAPALPKPSGKVAGHATGENADAVLEENGMFVGVCVHCAERMKPSASERGAKSALAAHKRHHHPDLVVKVTQDA